MGRIIFFGLCSLLMVIPFILITIEMSNKDTDPNSCYWYSDDNEHWETGCNANYRSIGFDYKCPVCHKMVRKRIR